MKGILKPPQLKDREKSFHGQILFTVLWTIILSSTALQVMNLFFVPERYARWIFILLFIDVICFSLLYLNWQGETRQAGIILLISLWLLTLIFSYIDGGINSRVVPIFIFIVVLSGFILGRRAVITGCMAFLFTGIALVILEDFGYFPKRRVIESSNFVILISYTSFIFFLAFLQDRYIKILRNAFFQAESEIEERLKIENALQISRDYSNNLLETVNVMVLGFDSGGKITVFNQTAQEISGYELSEILSDGSINKLMPCNQFPDSYNKFSKFTALGYPKVFESAILTKTGKVRYITWQCNEVSEHYQNVRWIAFGIDVTERKQHEREMEMITTVSTALRVAQTKYELLQVVLNKLHDLFNADLAAIASFSTDQQVVFDVLSDEELKRLFSRIFSHRNELGFILQSNELYLNNEVQKHPELKQYDRLQDMRALLCVPLITQGSHIGAIVIIRKNIILEEEARALTAVADITSNAIHRISSYEQAKDNIRRLAALHTLEMAISSHFDLPKLFETVLDQVVRQFRVDAADILLLSPDGIDFIYTAGRGFKNEEAIKKSRRRVGESLVGTSVLTKSIIYVANYSQSNEDTDLREIMLEEKITSYYAVPLITKDVVKGVLEIFLRYQVPPQPDWLEFLQMLGSITAISIDDAELFRNLQQANVELTNAYEATIEGWSHALDLRDRETEGHTLRVTELTLKLARKMGLTREELSHIRRGALLHDIGKMGVPDDILLKPGSLTYDEWDVMKMHPQYAFDMLSSIHYLSKALDIPYCHHEKWDGTGYPRGLKGEQIPLAARVFAVVDVWDAVTSDRPYRDAWSAEKALEYIRKGAGKHFDSQVVEAFLEMMMDQPVVEKG